MLKNIYIILAVICTAMCVTFSSCKKDKEDDNTDITEAFKDSMSSEEIKLYKLLMEYRKEKGLPTIPISNSLNFVAQTHVKDLHENFIYSNSCNMHSWSDKGNWTACCYTSDHAQAKCMWTKPMELTSYKGYGYEIAHIGGTTAESALNGWKNSSAHNAVIINEGLWQSKWNAIGIGMYKSYSVVWFGRELDE